MSATNDVASFAVPADGAPAGPNDIYMTELPFAPLDALLSGRATLDLRSLLNLSAVAEAIVLRDHLWVCGHADRAPGPFLTSLIEADFATDVDAEMWPELRGESTSGRIPIPLPKPATMMSLSVALSRTSCALYCQEEGIQKWPFLNMDHLPGDTWPLYVEWLSRAVARKDYWWERFPRKIHELMPSYQAAFTRVSAFRGKTKLDGADVAAPFWLLINQGRLISGRRVITMTDQMLLPFQLQAATESDFGSQVYSRLAECIETKHREAINAFRMRPIAVPPILSIALARAGGRDDLLTVLRGLREEMAPLRDVARKHAGAMLDASSMGEKIDCIRSMTNAADLAAKAVTGERTQAWLLAGIRALAPLSLRGAVGPVVEAVLEWNSQRALRADVRVFTSIYDQWRTLKDTHADVQRLFGSVDPLIAPFAKSYAELNRAYAEDVRSR